MRMTDMRSVWEILDCKPEGMLQLTDWGNRAIFKQGNLQLPCELHEGTRRSGGIAPLVLNLNIILGWMASFTSRLIYHRKNNPSVHTVQETG